MVGFRGLDLSECQKWLGEHRGGGRLLVPPEEEEALLTCSASHRC